MTKVRTRAADLLRDRVRLIHVKEADPLFLVGPIRLPVNLDGETHTFQWYSWLNATGLPEDPNELLALLPQLKLADHQQSSVLVYGDFSDSEDALIRMHSICHTGDIFGSKRCDCGFQLKESMRNIIAGGSGALFYLANHEGRGIGLFSKAMTYLLQENGYDTVEANLELGFEDDARSYEEALSVLQTLRDKPVTLMTNNPKKVKAMRALGLRTKQAGLWGDLSTYNRHYLETKVKKSGHIAGDRLPIHVFRPKLKVSSTQTLDSTR